MHFDDLPQDAEYRAGARAWLAANATAKQRSDEAWGAGLAEHEAFAAAQAWQAKKFDAGYGAISFPKAVGGAGGRAKSKGCWHGAEVTRSLADVRRGGLDHLSARPPRCG